MEPPVRHDDPRDIHPLALRDPLAEERNPLGPRVLERRKPGLGEHTRGRLGELPGGKRGWVGDASEQFDGIGPALAKRLVAEALRTGEGGDERGGTALVGEGVDGHGVLRMSDGADQRRGVGAGLER